MRFVAGVLILISIASCSPVKKLGLPKSIHETEKHFQDHVGFMLYDLEKKQTVFEHNSDKYFTPASNTKIFTLYTSLRIIGDSIPAINYIETPDSLIFWGTGDPSFLYHKTFTAPRVLEFLSRTKKPIAFSSSNFYTTHFGNGWAWDDYNDNYSAERSPFPIYGNLMRIERKGSLIKVFPQKFDEALKVVDRKEREQLVRDLNSNALSYHPGVKQGRSKSWEIPFAVNNDVITGLLSDTTKVKVSQSNLQKPAITTPLYSVPSDSLYKVMMQESDNFIAEQLLLICSDIIRDSLSTEIAIKYSKENFLRELPDKPVWVDGSGLSRYNLFTPRSIVKLWEIIYEQKSREKLFPLLAIGGKTGTLKNYFKAEEPFIFGKTGTVSNNHSLSGYLVTKSGKTLIFSFMNNNYVTPVAEVRKNMEKILYTIYKNY